MRRRLREEAGVHQVLLDAVPDALSRAACRASMRCHLPRLPPDLPQGAAIGEILLDAVPNELALRAGEG
jgi:hypothetical protein